MASTRHGRSSIGDPARGEAARSRMGPWLAASLAVVLLHSVACGGDSGPGTGDVVPEPPSDLVLRTTSLPDAESDVTWVAALEADGGTEPYRWSAVGAPSWLQVDGASGRLWGTPPAGTTGPVTFTATVLDAASVGASGALTLTVQPPSEALPAIALPALADASDGRFRTSSGCAPCHANASTATAMRDAASREIGPVDLWRASMMANAVRDPYFRAVLAAEQARHPGLSVAIEDKCLTCHAPAAAYEAHAAGGTLALADLLAPTARAQTGMDGTTCTVCHQIEPDGLGTAATFTAGFVVSPAKVGYARHAGPFGNPMVGNVGYVPTEATHTRTSALCGTCHTLFTETHDLQGVPQGTPFPEQTPYLEWRNSKFDDERAAPGPEAASCIACHAPSRDEDGLPIRTRIARNPAGNDFPPVSEREPYSRHAYFGGNSAVLRLLRDQAGDLAPPATTAQFDQLIAQTQGLLGGRAAALGLSNLRLEAGRLEVDVTVANLTGHKLPTAYPSRRAWLRLLVKDGAGSVVWRSGDHDGKGRLVDGQGRPLASEAAGGPVEPHRVRIEAQDQVQVYQSMMGNTAGLPDAGVLHAASYLKDNRLLPAGWSDTHPDIDVMRPVGVAGDPDFVGGGDTVRYVVSGLGAGPYAVEAQLLFQTIGARDVHELVPFDHLQPVSVFLQYWSATAHAPEILAAAAASTSR